jgi:hypothetical protein
MPVFVVVVLEPAGTAGHTFGPALSADGVVVLARLSSDGLASLACRPHVPESSGATRPARERRLAYSVWDRVELGFELYCQRWRTGRLLYVVLLQFSVKVGVADVDHFTDRR